MILVMMPKSFWAAVSFAVAVIVLSCLHKNHPDFFFAHCNHTGNDILCFDVAVQVEQVCAECDGLPVFLLHFSDVVQIPGPVFVPDDQIPAVHFHKLILDDIPCNAKILSVAKGVPWRRIVTDHGRIRQGCTVEQDGITVSLLFNFPFF